MNKTSLPGSYIILYCPGSIVIAIVKILTSACHIGKKSLYKFGEFRGQPYIKKHQGSYGYGQFPEYVNMGLYLSG